ncbi:MAG: beta galactosidase jelly roll domain-containing protein [Gemmatimonadota bacterium]|nr:MAG: beta galactosidase jelly roll domain-containing protein [Gemmatimonadota bacterium]
MDRVDRVIALPAACLLAVTAACGSEPAEYVRLPAVFGSHMVLQRDEPVAIWGWASPRSTVTVSIYDLHGEVRVNRDSTWRMMIPARQAGGPYTLTVAGVDTITFSDVMVGEVWIASGQSNMEWPLARTRDSAIEANAADYPDIRYLRVAHDVSYRRKSDVTAEGWLSVTPQTVLPFSAVAYFFGRKLHDELGVPVGIIQTTWGGTPAEAWTSSDGLEGISDFTEPLAAVAEHAAAGDEPLGWDESLTAWTETLLARDRGRQSGQTQWMAPELGTQGWASHPVPMTWSEGGLAEYDGVVWFRTTVDLPSGWSESDLVLSLGMVDDIDSTWVNGRPVGGTRGWRAQRRYTVSAMHWREGDNVIAVRVLDTGGGGGIHGDRDSVYVARGAERVSIAGDWQYRIGLEPADLPQLPAAPQNQVTTLFNAMLAPIIPVSMRGVIWYQGESNAGRAHQYRTLFPAMIHDWRRQWGRGDFPFLFVQLANYMAPQSDPVEPETWPELREAQSLALELANTAQAITIEIGEADDIHPRNKQDVGLRLALAALGTVYDQDVVYSGPSLREMTVEGNRIRLHFDHVGTGLVAAGDRLRGFAIAGEDRQFVWANADIDGETVLVSADGIAAPVAVRYAWANNPVISLFNREGLPASPFRTDDWPGVTEPTR